MLESVQKTICSHLWFSSLFETTSFGCLLLSVTQVRWQNECYNNFNWNGITHWRMNIVSVTSGKKVSPVINHVPSSYDGQVQVDIVDFSLLSDT